jgi:hypothetical protein
MKGYTSVYLGEKRLNALRADKEKGRSPSHVVVEAVDRYLALCKTEGKALYTHFSREEWGVLREFAREEHLDKIADADKRVFEPLFEKSEKDYLKQSVAKKDFLDKLLGLNNGQYLALVNELSEYLYNQ